MKELKPQSSSSIKNLIIRNRIPFLIDFGIILLITFGVLYLFGFVPEEFKNSIGREPVKETKGNEAGELPLHVTIPAIGVDADVYNPSSTSTDILDEFLQKGAVHYPGSGLPGGQGNVFIFGHSTGLAVVHNQAYKTFSGLQKLKAGDEITLYSASNAYIYKVLDVQMKSAADALVVFNTKSNMLTISTCDTFAAKTDRFIAEAAFVKKTVLPSSSAQ